MSIQDQDPVADRAIRCAVCPAEAVDPPPGVARRVPELELCDHHWSEYLSDWLLIGRCEGHYGQALTWCVEHHREIQPL